MSKVKSFDVGNGDMFYIKHNSDNFTVIDCCLSDENKDKIIKEIIDESTGKGIHRFISTHPDEDHIRGPKSLREKWGIPNFYYVNNSTTKSSRSESFEVYQQLMEKFDKFYFIEKGCKKKWMNLSDEERDSSGISILWPNTNNKHFKEALQTAADGGSPNNISPIIHYRGGGMSFLWMGDLEHDFME